jgi:hypothetical protein
MARKSSTKTSSANLGFEHKLWLAADKLRNNMDAAEPGGANQIAKSNRQDEHEGIHLFPIPAHLNLNT